MKFQRSSESDLKELAAWFGSQAEVRLWGGPSISYPIEAQQFKAELLWGINQSFSLSADDGQLLGFIQVADKFGCNHICRVLIKPSARGQRLGSYLMGRAVESFIPNERDYSLFVYDDNKAAIGLYSKLGFRVEPHPEGAAERLADCVFMLKPNI